jgi:hypothetical protein
VCVSNVCDVENSKRGGLGPIWAAALQKLYIYIYIIPKLTFTRHLMGNLKRGADCIAIKNKLLCILK